VPEVHEQLGRLDARLAAVERDLRAVLRECVDPGVEGTLRWRVHELENDRLAARAATDALRAARDARAAAAEARGVKWGFRWKVVATLLGLPLLVMPWLNFFLILRKG
jgi:hypothetical protein